MKLLLFFLPYLAAAQGLITATWPPTINAPAPVYITPSAGTSKIEPIILGPNILPPIQTLNGWLITSKASAEVTSSGWIPFVKAVNQPVDGTEKWCYGFSSNPAVDIDNVPVILPIHPTAVNDNVQKTISSPNSPPGVYVYETFTVVQPGPILDGSNNLILMFPVWRKVDTDCVQSNPSITMPPFTVLSGTSYIRLSLLVLANW